VVNKLLQLSYVTKQYWGLV